MKTFNSFGPSYFPGAPARFDLGVGVGCIICSVTPTPTPPTEDDLVWDDGDVVQWDDGDTVKFDN